MNAEQNSWGVSPLKLKFPVTTEAGTITEIIMREPNGEALEAIDDLNMQEGERPTMRQTLALIRILSGISKDVTDKMHRDDIMGAMEALGPLLEPGAKASQEPPASGENTATK